MSNAPLKILLVEDNPADADLFQEILDGVSSLPWELAHVESLQAAIAHLDAQACDVVLSDLSLPDAQGLEAVTKLHADFPDLAIVVLTGLRSEEVGLSALRAGAQDYLVKGQIDYSLLVRTIRYAVERSKTQRVMRQQAAAMAASRDGIAIVDQHHCFTYLNQAFVDIYGYHQPTELLGQKCWSVYADHEQTKIQQDIFPAIATLHHWSGEIMGQRRDGTLFDQELSLSRFGQQEFVCIIRDISDRKLAEASLRIARYSLDRVGDAVFLVQDDGQILYVNEAACEALGYSQDELLALSIDRIDPHYPQARWQTHWQHLKQQGSYTEESINLTKSGQEIPVELNSSYLEFDDKEFKCTIVRNISDRKRSEEALRQSEEKFRQLAENIHDCFFLLSADGQQLLYISPGYQDIWGYPCPSLTEDPKACFFDGAHLEDQNRIRQSFKAHLSAKTDLNDEYRIVQSDGTVRWVWIRASYVLNADGRPYRIAGIAEDISDRKQAETALQSQFRLLQILIDTIPNPIFYKDTKGIYLGCNRAFEDYLGINREVIIGQTIDAIAPPDLANSYRDDANTLRHLHGGNQVYESSVVRADGTRQDVIFYKAMFHDANGRPQGIVGTLLDITERKQTEADILQTLEHEKELNELKSRFISTASHEFRTPLTTILSATELLEYPDYKLKPEKRLRYYQQIKSAVQHMIQLLDDVLLISRYDSGRLSFTPIPLDLAEFCRTLVEGIQLNANQQHAIQFTYLPPSLEELAAIAGQPINLPLRPYLDEKLLRHVISNLLSNALKYSPAHIEIEFQVTIRPSPQAEAPLMATFLIRDRGIGIPSEDLSRLFEPFHRAKNVGTIPGTGLGLSIVKNAIDLHGGHIQIDSILGEGTSFMVELPLHFAATGFTSIPHPESLTSSGVLYEQS
ncbi:MAG: PAS domain S-box protein [Leptolyngbya sp. DLM2.Bin15]|nr:MAG: PAS domain S-box protein [Leptolyngbya sp. DLM2.Bin15]